MRVSSGEGRVMECLLVIMRYPDESSYIFEALMRFLDDITWVLVPDVVTRRFAYEISWFLAVVRCPCEICCVWLHSFVMRYPDESSFFLTVMSCHAFCCTLFVRDILMRCYAFGSRCELCV
jgi:hypothetical protein